MKMNVGQDTSKARLRLSLDPKKIAYCSEWAAEAAGLGEFSDFSTVQNASLDNLLRLADGNGDIINDINTRTVRKIV